MYKIEVDPKLFITCRLCLDEMGQYQIDPNVQGQIKFCFDIDVDTFDGLPQLICKKCETILSDFNEKKKTYQEKQLYLRKNLKSNCIVSAPLQQQDTVSSTQSTTQETNPKQLKLTLKKKAQSTDTDVIDSFVKDDTKTARSWRKNYNKYFVCRMCDVVYKNKKVLMTHMEKHDVLLKKYGPILKNCRIQLPRIDEKTNSVSSDDMVVVDEDKILLNKNDRYRIIYIRKTSGYHGKKTSSDTSDDDVINKRKRKRLRLLSHSSNETVVLEDPKKKQSPGTSKDKPQNIIECVDIDSTDSEPPSPIANDVAKKNILEIVSSCVKTFNAEKDSHPDSDSFKDIQLQHKILSIGRKVVNNKSFNCTGLLRYLEHKNLAIQWNPRTGQIPETDFVHVRTRVQDNKKHDEPGWKIASKLKGSDSNTYMENLQKILETDELPTPDHYLLPEATLEQVSNENTPENILLKLLNTNPVANPKQLPKKARETNKNAPNDLTTLVTNTVSLTDVAIKDVHKADEPFVPRIKVKPVSQLMADKSATITETTPAQVAWTIPENVPRNQMVHHDWVVMHTVELPQTKTLSPFKYFQNLLQMHGIILMNTTAQVPSDFVSLIKFKSVFKQETKRVTLSLGLLSDSKQFYIKVTESTNEQLDINTLIPTWQWEILSLYKSEIAKNILDNAQRVSQKMYDSTNYFISLLKSIVFKRP